jgi:hypothetical protein
VMSARSRLDRRSDARTPSTGSAFLIVSEGSVTEPEYFRALRDRLGLASVLVDIVSADGTDPVSVVDHAERLRRARMREAKRGSLTRVAYDEVRAVFDTERHDTNSRLAPALDRARALGICVALSNPCVE